MNMLVNEQPEYSQVELEKLQKLHEWRELCENSSSDEELNSSRLENLHGANVHCCVVIYNTFKLVAERVFNSLGKW